MPKYLSTIFAVLFALILTACSSTPSVEETASVEDINASGADDGTDLTDAGGDGSDGGVSSAGVTDDGSGGVRADQVVVFDRNAPVFCVK